MENNKFKSIEVKSPVLLLIGPLGYFFQGYPIICSRMASKCTKCSFH